jgi:hypothetical protein
MRFDELNEDNYLIFAIKNYDNPQSLTQDDFYEDLKRFNWINRLLKKHKSSGTLNIHLLINHFIIIYNVFGDAATPLLFYKVDSQFWSILKTFIVYLGRLPEYPKTDVHNIPIDINFLKQLNVI